jgi:hypothetical protein
MSTLIANLFWHYVHDGWLFCGLHVLFLGLFLFRWSRSWLRVGKLRNDLKKNSGSSDLDYAKDQIKRYANQGREPDLPRIEGYITDRFQHDPELIRGLINAFIVVGLMGTLFSLFAMGEQAGNFREPSEILSRMGIAFSTSFFGIVWALGCSVLLLNPLRRRTNDAVQEVHRKLTELSADHPPDAPQKGLELVAEILRENVNSIGAVINRLEEREEENRSSSRQILTQFSDTTTNLINQLSTSVAKAHTRTDDTLRETLHSIRVIVERLEEGEKENRSSSRQILTQFSDTTTNIINQLLTNLEEAQTRTTMVSLSLKESITSSLTELKERFLEISQSWRAEMQQTLAATEDAAISLSGSSNNLAESTKDVSNTLRSVSIALERTKELAEIVVAIEKVTRAYLDQTGDQINIFKTGLGTTLDAVRAIPDEWYTMLTLVKDDLAKQFQETANGWQAHVEVTGNILASRTEAVSSSMTSLSEFFAPQAALVLTLKELNEVLLQTKDWLDTHSKTVTRPLVDGTVGVRENLDHAVGEIDTTGASKGRMGSDNGRADLSTLIEAVESIRMRLDDFLISKHGPLASEPPISKKAPEGTKLGIAVTDINVPSDLTVDGQNGKIEMEAIEFGHERREDRGIGAEAESQEIDVVKLASDHLPNDLSNGTHGKIDLTDIVAASNRFDGQLVEHQSEPASTLVETADNRSVRSTADPKESGEIEQAIDVSPLGTSSPNVEHRSEAVGWRRFLPKRFRKKSEYK